MQLTSRVSFLAAAAVVVFSCCTQLVEAQYYTHLVLNNGTSTASMECSNSEWNSILAVLTTATQKYHPARRNLKGSLSSGQQERHLAVRCGARYSAWSGKGCAAATTADLEAYVAANPDWWKFWEWRRQRRNLATSSSSSSIHRQEQQTNASSSSPCYNEAVTMNTTLNTIHTVLPNLSTKCLALVAAKRTFSCRLDVPCAIAKVNLWSTKPNRTMIRENFPASGGTVCYSSRPTFEAIPVFDMGWINFQLTGTNYTHSKEENMSPYVLFGNSGSYYNGNYLNVGNYTLKIFTEDVTKSKIITFNVTNC